MKVHEEVLVVGELDEPLRLDKYISDQLGYFPRSQYERREVSTWINGKPVKGSFKVSGGESLKVIWHDLPETNVEAEAMDLDVLYEDGTVIVVNKVQGMVVHPAHGNWSGTLVQGLLHRVKDLAEAFDAEPDGELRPGIVHRLDKDTSGVLITAKTPEALEFLSSQFRDRSTEKVYWAVLKGNPKVSSGIVEGFLGRDPRNRQRFAAVGPAQGKSAVTEWKVLSQSPGYSFVEFRPRTGRTHQLRVHSVVLGFPILGDPLYARPDRQIPEATLMLHARSLSIVLPDGIRRTFTAPIPELFRTTLERLGLPVPRLDGLN